GVEPRHAARLDPADAGRGAPRIFEIAIGRLLCDGIAHRLIAGGARRDDVELCPLLADMPGRRETEDPLDRLRNPHDPMVSVGLPYPIGHAVDDVAEAPFALGELLRCALPLGHVAYGADHALHRAGRV